MRGGGREIVWNSPKSRSAPQILFEGRVMSFWKPIVGISRMQGFWVCGGGRCCELREFSRRRPTHIFTCPFFPCLRPVFLGAGTTLLTSPRHPIFGISQKNGPMSWVHVKSKTQKSTKNSWKILRIYVWETRKVLENKIFGALQVRSRFLASSARLHQINRSTGACGGHGASDEGGRGSVCRQRCRVCTRKWLLQRRSGRVSQKTACC